MAVTVPPLREVRGPSALGGGRRRAFELLYLIAVTEFRRTYLGTALGYLWSLARPLLLFAVLLLVFTQAFDLGDRVQQYPVLLLFNIVLFSFFQEATTQAVPSIVTQESIVRKTQFPRLVIPLAVVVTSALNLTVNLVVVLAFLLFSGVEPMWTWLLFPLVLVLLFVLTTAVAMIVVRALPALPRHGHPVGRRGHRAVLRDAGAVPDRARVRAAARPDRAQSADAAVRARAPLGDRPGRAGARGAARAGRRLRRGLRPRGVGLQPRGATDRGGAVMAARVAVAVVAVVVLAWLAVMERDARLEARGVALAGSAQRATDYDRAHDAFRAASFLNPDTTPEVGRALLYKAQRDQRRAVATIEAVLAHEPDNLAAWGVLYAFTREPDPAAARRALDERRRLDPLAARSPG